MHELDQLRGVRSDHELATPERATPGRRSASSALIGPTHPVVSGLIARKGAGAGEVDADAETAVQTAAGSSGHELPGAVRDKFESSLGTDLSSVRVHTGADSHAAASSVGALAYATGNDIHFADGQYDPQSDQGQQLLAHEVAHTVQQRGGSPARQHKLEISQPGDGFEVEADRAASAMVSGTPFSLGSAATTIARNPTNKQKDEFDKEMGKKPTISDGINIPVLGGKAGSLNFKWGEGSFNSPVAKAKIDLKKFEEKLQVQIAPGIVGELAVDAGLSVAASASASLTGKLEPTMMPNVFDEQLRMQASGGGTLAATAAGGIRLGAGPGLAYCSATAGINGKLSATGSLGATFSGAVTGTTSETIAGELKLDVGGKASLEMSGSLSFDVVFADRRAELVTYELVKAPIAEATVNCIATYGPGGVKTQEPIIETKILALATAKRSTVKLSEAERKKLMPVEQGASGAPSAVPEDRPMSDAELLVEGKKLVKSAFEQGLGKPATIVSSAGTGVTIDVNGHRVGGLATIPRDRELVMREHGHMLTRVKAGTLTNYQFTENGALAGEKTVEAVTARMFKTAQADIVATDIETEPDPKNPMGPCKI